MAITPELVEPKKFWAKRKVRGKLTSDSTLERGENSSFKVEKKGNGMIRKKVLSSPEHWD